MLLTSSMDYIYNHQHSTALVYAYNTLGYDIYIGHRIIDFLMQ